MPMSPNRSWPILTLAAGCLALTGCGGGGGARRVDLGGVPLPSGTRVTTHVESCDRGANAYCAQQVVVIGDRYRTSAALLNREKRHLAQLGWTTSEGADGDEMAAESRGHRLRLTFATAYDDLLGVDSKWIQRRPPVTHALSDAVFDRASAISLMLEQGSS